MPDPVATEFLIEPLEPRILFSADLAPSATILHGLHDLQADLNLVTTTLPGTSTIPFVNRSIADFAKLGDPIAAIVSAAQTYYQNPAHTTLAGLADALNQLPHAGDQTKPLANVVQLSGGGEGIALSLVEPVTHQTATVDLADETGTKLAFQTPQTADVTGTVSLALTFGADANGDFVVQSGGTATETVNTTATLSGGLTVGTVATTMVAGSTAQSTTTLDAMLQHATDAAALTDADLQAAATAGSTASIATAAPLAGGGTAHLELTAPSLAQQESVTIDAAVPDQPGTATITYDTPDSQLAPAPVAPVHSFARALVQPAVAPVTPSALGSQVNAVIGDISTELTTIQGDINAATALASDLPFVGDSLKTENIFQPIIGQLGALQNTITKDFSDNTTLLTQIKADVVAAFSSLGVLPGTPANDVVLDYVANGATGTVSDGSTVNLAQVTQVELDLSLGGTWTKAIPVGTDIGIPGLGLKVTPGSTINGSITWTFGFGFGLTANDAYLVAGATGNTGTPLNLTVGFTLGNGFQAVGTIGFLQALLTEKSAATDTPPAGGYAAGTAPAAGTTHTGLTGTIGIGLGGVSDGSGLDGGLRINLADVAAVTATPAFSLQAHSNLGMAFGGDFVKGSDGNYTDVSEFPSIAASLKFEWTIGTGSLATASVPTVGLDDITFDIGTAITNLLLPVLKPIYDATDGMSDVIDFLTKPVPIINSIVTGANGLGVPQSAINEFFPSYTSGSTYDWLHFTIDFLVHEDEITNDEARVIAPIAEDVIKVIKQIDQLFSTTQGLASQDLGVTLGNLDFAGKDLRLPQESVTDVAGIASLGARVGNFSGLTGDDVGSAIEGAISGLGSLIPAGPVRDLVGSVTGLVGDVAGDIDNLVSTVADDVDPGADDGITTHSVATFETPFLQDPSSVLGLLFGQNVVFFKVGVGFSADFKFDADLVDIDFFGLIQAALTLNLSADVSVGLQAEYDSTGLLELLGSQQAPSNETPAEMLLDGIKFGPNPLLAGQKNANDILSLTGNFSLGLDASVLEGLASAGIEGGLALSFEASLPGSTTANPFVNINQIEADESLYSGPGGVDAENNGFAGPLQLQASGYAYLDFVYKTLWGLGPHHTTEIARDTIFNYPSNKPLAQDVGPLGFYDSQSETLTLYMGPLSSRRDYNIQTGGDLDNAGDADDVAANDSTDYTIDVDGNNRVVIHYHNPTTGVDETQTPSGPVALIRSNTGDGKSSILVNNTAPNTTQVDFEGAGGSKVYNPQATTASAPTAAGVAIPGSVTFTSAGGSAKLIGADGNNSLTGSANADTIIGGAGNDTIISNGGDDTITGGAGNDSIVLTGGNTIVDGGDGNDTVDFSKEATGVVANVATGQLIQGTATNGHISNIETLIGTPYDDTLIAGDQASTIYGGAGNDSIVGGALGDVLYGSDPATLATKNAAADGNDTIQGGGGNDTIFSGYGTDQVEGDGGSDVITVGDGNSTVYGDAAVSQPSDGNDQITVGNGTDLIYGGGGNDTIVAGSGGDYIQGGAGADTITAGDGNSTVYGDAAMALATDGADSITLGNGANFVYAGNGNDTVSVGGGNNAIEGDAGADKITTGNGNSTVYGDAATVLATDGADSITLGNGANLVYAGAGNDTVKAGSGSNYIEGDAGADQITTTGNGNSTVYGDQPGTLATDGADMITVGGGVNVVYGGAGNDTVTAGGGSNYIEGDAGADQITTTGNGNSTVYGDQPGTLATDGADMITVGGGANVIYGGAGNDTVAAGGGSNYIEGDAGADRITTTGSGNSTIYGDAPIALATDAADLITVGDGANVIYGGGGNDTVHAGNGANYIEGGSEADLITTGNGNSTIYGDAPVNVASDGNDTINAGNGVNYIYGGGGDDSIIAGSGGDYIEGDTGNDSILAGNGNNTVYGNDGTDTITTGSGMDWIDGGAGDDLIHAGAGDDTIQGGADDDTIYGGAGNDLIYGDDSLGLTTGQDVIYGDDGSVLVNGENGSPTDGNDTIYAGTGNDLVYGEGGNDVIYAQDGDDTVYGDAGADFIDGGTGDDLLYGGSGNDTIYGGAGSDRIDGGLGDDLLSGGDDPALPTAPSGGTDSDTVYGDAGNDTIIGGAGYNILDGGTGDDLITGAGINNLITGDDGNDTLVAGNNGDTLYGGAGNDSLVGGSGNDFLDGGTGANIIHGGAGNDTLTVDGGVGNQLFGEGGNDVIYGAPAGAGSDVGVAVPQQGDLLSGGDGNDTIYGSGGADTIDGGVGNDSIVAGPGGALITGDAGDDTLTGGAGNDTIFGGLGDDSIVGNGGNDVLYGNDATNFAADGALLVAAVASVGDGDQDTILGGAGNDIIYGGTGVDYIDGGTGTDLIRGGPAENTIYGGGGRDTIYGGGAADVIIGSSDAGSEIHGGGGNDRLQGGAGNDTIYGDAGDDVIDGGAGDDLLIGGTGADLLVGGAGNDTLYGQSVDDSGDDNAPDTLFGDFGTNGNEPGSGADKLYGQGGNDVLYGEGGVNYVDPGTGGGDTDVAAEVKNPAYVTPTPSPVPVLAADVPVVADVALPTSTAGLGWWSPVASPTGGLTLGGADQDVRDVAVTASSSGPVAAWTQETGGLSGVYVATEMNGTWTGLAGSDQGTGILGVTGAGYHPTIATDGSKVYVAWTSVSAAGTSIDAAVYDPTANAGAGGWHTLGASMAAGGISGYGVVDDARVVVTAAGPVITWIDAGNGDALHASRFNGTTWADVSTGLAGTTASADYTITTDGTHVAVGWSQVSATGTDLTLLQFDGTSWTALAAPNAAVPVDDSRSSDSPSLAYSGGSLFAAWVQHDSAALYRSQIYVARETGGTWTPASTGSDSGAGLSGGDAVSILPQLAATPTGLRLVWASVDGTGDAMLRTMVYDGTTFSAERPTDTTGTGIGDIHGVPTAMALVVGPSGTTFLATSIGEGAGFTLRQGDTSAAHVFTADATHSIASILASGAVQSGDLILVAGETQDTTLSLGASAAGVTIAGLDGSGIAGSITIDGATGVTLRNLAIGGAVSITGTSGVHLVESSLKTLTLDGATNVEVRDDHIDGTVDGILIASASSGTIHDNVITATVGSGSVGLHIEGVFTGSITANDIGFAGTGVVYDAAAPLSDNRIHDNATGVVTTVAGAGALGFNPGSSGNIITGNMVGLVVTAARAAGQTIEANGVGVTGSGTLGGSDLTTANLITGNTIAGVQTFTGTVAFNTIEKSPIGLTGVVGTIENNVIDKNAQGIVATNRQVIFDNQMMFNTDAAILVAGVANLRIAGNTIRSSQGDAIRLQNGANNVDIVSNVLWVDQGYDLNVANDSQTGFWSDYNTLYAGTNGKLVYWTQAFTDILDWQDDVAQFDLHSVGTTVVDPNRAEPHLAEALNGLYTIMPLEAGQSDSDLAAGNGDPAGSFIGYSGATNLLSDGDFENNLTGWTATTGGATTTTGPVAYTGSAVFASGPASTAVLQQSIDLVAAGYSTSELDSGGLEVAFGGRVLLPSSSVTGQIALVFHDQSGNTIGTTTLPAGTDVGRYLRVFDTVVVPVGARSAQFVFSVTNSGTSLGGILDDAYLAVIPRGIDLDQGQGPVATNPTAPVVPEPDGRLAITSPDLYTDWELNKPHVITWNSYGSAAGSAVRIELWQDGPNGPALLSVIAASTADTGSYNWTPSTNGLTYGTEGLRIRIERVSDPAVFSLSAETFAVPENGTHYYVNDGSTVGDDPTIDTGIGSNRNTGKAPNAPKPNLTNIFRTYDVGAGSIVSVNTGDYPLIDALQLSGSVDRGFGLDSGFTIQGPTNGGIATLHPAVAGANPPALIDLLDADFVTLNNLDFVGGVNAVLVHGGSDSFSASNLTASGQSGDGFAITTNAPTGSLKGLTASNDGGVGLRFTGTIGSITFLTAADDAEGLLVNGTVPIISDNTITGNRSWGLDLTLTGGSTVQHNIVTGNTYGVFLSGDGITFGDADLTAGRGNILSGNSNYGVYARGAIDVVGNVITGAAGATGIYLSNGGAHAEDNDVSGNATGIDVSTGTTLTGNRVYNNTGSGIEVDYSSIVVKNTVYSNGVGINVYGSGATLQNNLIYADREIGVWLHASTTVINNTIDEPTAGTGADPGTGVGTAAVVLSNGAQNTTFSDNIVVALAGIGITVADAAQAGFVSNYNLFQTGVGGRIGNWLGADRATLAAWRAATSRDKNSLFGDPDFVDADGADNVLGYASPTQNGQDDDFHVQTPDGSFHGGSLSVELNATTGLLSLPGGTLTTTDTGRSPAIDAGDPTVPVGAETAPNGGIVEIGAYGGTAQASRSPTAFLTVTSPNGGETLFQGATVTVTWNSFNVTGTVDLTVSDGTTTTTIASGIADSGSYVWTIDPATFVGGSTYRLSVTSDAMPSVTDTSDATFTISAPVHMYYVNGQSSAGDFTTAGGSDSNSGLDKNDPLASLGALLAKYKLQPGDVVLVDAGTYALTQNIVFDATQSGTATDPIIIEGDGTKTIFDRGSNSGGFYDFDIKGAKYVTFEDMQLQGAQWQFYVETNAGSTGISLSNVTVDLPTSGNSGIYVGAGNDGFSLDKSTLTGPGYDGLELDGDNGATVTNSSFTNFSTGVQINGTTGSTLRNDTFVGDNAATGTSFTYGFLFDHLTASGGYYGISTSRSQGTIENSTVHDTGAYGITADAVYGIPVIATGNTVYNIGGNNETPGALIVDNGAIATNNTVYDSYNGIVVSGTATGNVVYGNTGFGIVVNGGTVSQNDIHDNVVGVLFGSPNSSIVNNDIIDNSTAGVQVNQYSNGIGNFGIINNTIVQAKGSALLSVGNPYNTTVRDNIIAIASGAVGFTVPATAQIGFISDYNLFDIAAGGTLAQWAGKATDFTTWQVDLGFDPNGLAADPRFTDAADDNFIPLTGSPAIDAGDPALPYANEPANNGGRIDIGATGNTANAIGATPTTGSSPAQSIEILSPGGQPKVAVGQQVSLAFRTNGFVQAGDFTIGGTYALSNYALTNSTPLLMVNTGGSAVTATSGAVFAASGYETGTSYTSTNNTTITSLIPDAAQPPASLFQSYDYAGSGVGQKLSYQLTAIPDGTYALTLYFADPAAYAAGQHSFDIQVNGQVPVAALLNDTTQISAAGIDPYTLAGKKDNTAISVTVLAQATGGKIAFNLTNQSNTFGPFLNGFALAVLKPETSQTATVSVSTDGGSTFTTIGQNVAINAYGQGSFAWDG